MLYEALFRRLHAAQIRYLVVGAVAINLHGIPRMTADLDLMVDLAEGNLDAFVRALSALGYRPRVPVAATDFLNPAKRREWQESKSMVMFTWIHPDRPYEEVDVFLLNPIDFQSAYSKRKNLQVEDFTISLAGVVDLKRGGLFLPRHGRADPPLARAPDPRQAPVAGGRQPPSRSGPPPQDPRHPRPLSPWRSVTIAARRPNAKGVSACRPLRLRRAERSEASR